jgi:peptidoglycan/LPS O-acetylase OafA/YrhL
MSRRAHWPQLDGVRAVAIAGVVAYHLGYLPGGWIGVDVFFVLSGYLITSILLSAPGPVSAFWGRRARRLLPAVVLLLLVVSMYAWAGGPGLVPAQLRDPALATVFYVANWQQIVSGHSYFAQFTSPSVLQHTWSLAIEEQYYLVWPLLLGLMVRRLGRRLVPATVSLAAASAIWMGVAAHIYGINRAYLGTDTRAWELLLGGALAMTFPSGRPATRPRAWGLAATAGFAAVVAGALTAGGLPGWIWDGGLVGISAGAGLIIVGSLRAPSSLTARVLAWGRMQWLGTVSYSLYLWHWPTIVLMTPSTTGLSGLSLLVARLAAMLAASCASFYAVESPLRRFDWAGLARRLRIRVPALATGAVLLTSVLIVESTVGPPAASSAAVSLPSPVASAPRLLNLTGPYRVWLFGDSVMADASPGVQAALQATGDVKVVINSAFPGWGLVRDKQWPFDAEASIHQFHPQIAIGTWSWDDTEAAVSPALYLARLESAMRTLLDSEGVKLVVLLQFPQTGPSSVWAEQTRVQDDWDALAEKAVAAFPGRALYLTTDRLFAPGGRFYAWFKSPAGTWIRARKIDNTHFCPYGAASFGALITDELTKPLDLRPMKPGWELGTWTHDRRYNDPPGACPDDQPAAGYRGVALPTV